MIWDFWRKIFLWVIFCHFGGHRPMSSKNFVKIGPFKLKSWLLAYFCMRNPKKVVPRRFVDPPDSNMGGFYRY